jgi:D-glycero-alpha-D-manno-heptose-7-phosphate kinase
VGQITRPGTKVRAKAPLRLGLGGGGTDVSPYSDRFGGMVLNATISLYAHCSVERRGDNRVVIHALDMDELFEADATPALSTDHPLKLICQAYNRIVRDYCKGEPFGATITTYADVPPGSGLGSSSTLVVAVVTALAELQRLPLGEYEIARLAYEIERLDLGLAGGKQDQYAATFGGFNLMEFYENDRVIINPLRLRSGTLCELEASLILYFSGRSRVSATIIEEQVKNVTSGSAQSLDAMHALKEQARRMKEALLLEDFKRFGEELRSGWAAKRATAHQISSESIEHVMDVAMKAGAFGGKVSGAGGGGFLMIATPPERRPAILRKLSELKGTVYNSVFTENGVRAWRVR